MATLRAVIDPHTLRTTITAGETAQTATDAAAVTLSTRVDAAGAPLTALCTGGNGAGTLTLTGAAIGDRVVGLTNLTDLTEPPFSDFEAVITGTDAIEQLASVHTGDIIQVAMSRPV